MNWCTEKSYWRQDIPFRQYVKAVLASVGLVGILTYLFYDVWIAGILLIPVGILCFKEQIQIAAKKQEAEFKTQFLNAVQMMISAMKVGYSVENAIRETKKDLYPLYGDKARICREFSKMIYQLNLNQAVEQVLEDFSKRVNLQEVTNFVTVFSIAKRSGGDSIQILKDTVRLISGKVETEREIQLLIAAKKMEFQVMCVIPMGMVCYVRMMFPEFLSVLYRNLTGIVLMSICLVGYILAYFWGKKIIRIEV